MSLASRVFEQKLESLRVTATCRCRAISAKLNKAISVILSWASPMDEPNYHACCWVCCDCSIDRFLEEVDA